MWFPRLFHASTQKRSHWEILGTGQGIHWADVDEDLSVDGLLRGMRAPSPTEAQQPNQGMEPTAYSARCAPASGSGSCLAFGY